MATATESTYLDDLEKDINASPLEQNDAPVKSSRTRKSSGADEQAYADGIRNDIERCMNMVSELRDQLGGLEEQINPVLGPHRKASNSESDSQDSPEQAPLRHAIANLQYGIQAAQERVRSMQERVEL